MLFGSNSVNWTPSFVLSSDTVRQYLYLRVDLDSGGLNWSTTLHLNKLLWKVSEEMDPHEQVSSLAYQPFSHVFI